MTNPDVDGLMRFAMLSAVPIATRPHTEFRSPHDRDDAVIRRVLEALAANGYIEIIHRDERPADYVADPPYRETWA